ncbi:EAL domain-containing protein [uncultured Pseudomonas sp.]|uniref:sensor domain-containing protein n=1 Tax=uncultured Pseudomonas sp. TaxID=114707 RepID=UPI0025ED7879|nr:EAL domain-containing protein [uncultured Pseudomonas sp.]
MNTPPSTLPEEPIAPSPRRLTCALLVLSLVVMLAMMFWQALNGVAERSALRHEQLESLTRQLANTLDFSLALKAQAVRSTLRGADDPNLPLTPNQRLSLDDFFPGLEQVRWLPANAALRAARLAEAPDAAFLQQLLKRTNHADFLQADFLYDFNPAAKAPLYLVIAGDPDQQRGWWVLNGAPLSEVLWRQTRMTEGLDWRLEDLNQGITLFSTQPQNTATENVVRQPLAHSDWQVVAAYSATGGPGLHLQESLGRLALFTFFGLVTGVLLHLLLREDQGLRALTQASRRSLRLAGTALNGIEEFVCMTQADGRLVYVNATAGRVLGIAPSEASQYYLASLLPQLVAPAHAEAGGQPLVTLWVDEQPRRFSVSCHALADSQPSARVLRDRTQVQDGFVWVLRDVTEQQRNLDTIQTTRQRYENIFNGVHTGICVVDLSGLYPALQTLGIETPEQLTELLTNQPETFESLGRRVRITEINQRALEMLGIDRLDQAWERLVGHSRVQPGGKRYRLLAGLLSGQQVLELETCIESGAGERHLWLSMHLPADPQHLDATLLSLNDITQRKLSELRLLERDAFWSNLISAIPDTLYTYDVASGELTYESHPLALKLGYAPGVLTSLGRERLHPDDAELHARVVSMRPTLSDQPSSSLLRWQHRNGGWRWFDVREQRLASRPDGTAASVVGLALDVTDMVRASDRLRGSENRYRQLAESISDVIFTTDAQLVLSYISPSVEELLGYTIAELQQRRLTDLVVHTRQLQEFRRTLQHLMRSLDDPRALSVLRQERFAPQVLDCLHAAGHTLQIELRLKPLWDDHERFAGLLGVCRDISAQRRTDKDMRMAATVFDHSAGAILVTDPAGYIVRVNRTFTRITGFTPEQVLDQQPMMLCADKQEANQLQHVMQQLRTEESWEGELWQRRHDNEPYPSWVGITAIRDDDGDLMSYVCFFVDISERKASERRIHRLAYYDALTLLPNRTLFQDRLHNALQQSRHNGSWVVLMFLDLDRFKPINDSLGHAAGDRLLKEVAVRLTACVGTEDSVARMGGDEFTLLLYGLESRETALAQAIRVGEQILAQLSDPFILEGREFFVSASIGIALSPQDGHELSQLMKNADTAMYHAKEMGKNNFQFYQAEMNARALERLELEADLRHALLQGEFRLHYQPQYRCDNRRLTGVEALLRWEHPVRGHVSPAEFIPVLEEIGLVVQVGDWVIREACRQMREWHAAKVRIPKVSVNLSARQFNDGQLGQRIAQILAETGLAPACLELELTESILMRDVGEALMLLGELKNLGLCIAVDDFGTGYSSLNYLKQFPIDILKIDRSFVDGLPHGEQDAQIARAIIAMAHSLNLSVIAEGVEEQEQLDFLCAHGCDEVQGFLFDRPLPPEQLRKRLERQGLFPVLT